MAKNIFRLIKGGIKPKEGSPKKFISSYVTDTRLMGVVVLFIRWEVLDCEDAEDLVQFFYFDSEEFGLETVENIWGYQKDFIKHIENKMTGCLGGKKVPLNEDEACYLVQYFHDYNIKHNLPVPKEGFDYKFILEKPISMTSHVIEIVHEKFCTEVDCQYEAIHYCLMRIFGKDFEGASYVCDSSLALEDLDIYPNIPMATFHQNEIIEADGYYLCESLVNAKNKYYICKTRVDLDDLKVVNLDPISILPISEKEAALILIDEEYIMFYKTKADDEYLPPVDFTIPPNSTVSLHSNGQLIMMYKTNNNHVKQRIFRLKDDIYGSFFITDDFQIIISAPSRPYALKLQDYFMATPLYKYMELVEKYLFRGSLLLEFIDSGFDDFEEFIALTTTER